MDTEKEFFKGKRPWSIIKDKVLNGYLPPYIKKVSQLGKKIIIVDSFAGPGTFDDRNVGSPLQICKIGEQFARNNFKAILVNNNPLHHKILTDNLKDYTEKKIAFPIYGKSTELLSKLNEVLTDETILIYLDPFGLKGTNFQTLELFLKRPKIYSTEIIINLSIPTIFRLSGKSDSKDIRTQRVIAAKHELLTSVLGGNYWKEYIYNTKLTTEQKIFKIVENYLNNLKKHLPYVGSCPVFDFIASNRLKYFIIFASRHNDAMLLMNNIMFDAYWKYIWDVNTIGTLFESEEWLNILPTEYYSALENKIIEILSNHKMSRKDLWKRIVNCIFMKFHERDFNSKINELLKNKKIDYIDIKGTGKLNNTSIIYKK